LGKKGLNRPPFIDPNDESKGLYESCTNETKDMFIFFENSQIYPEYIIYYTTVDPFEEK